MSCRHLRALAMTVIAVRYAAAMLHTFAYVPRHPRALFACVSEMPIWHGGFAWSGGNEYPYRSITTPPTGRYSYLPSPHHLGSPAKVGRAARMRELSRRTDDGPLTKVTKVDHIKGYLDSAYLLRTLYVYITADSSLGHDHDQIQSPANVFIQ